LRLDYAQFLELEVFTRFGGMPEGRVRQQLTRGARIREALKQSQHSPFRLVDEVALLIAVQSGLLDPLPVSAVTAFRERLPAILDSDAAESVRVISETDNLDEAARAMLIAAMTGLASSLSAIKNDTSHDIVSHNPERTGEKA
jgi:F-type H+-transporting ATPase subunit alpha